MKMFGKNEDRVIDNLLRANTRGRSSGAPTSCREFDPDLANAYIERSLTASERAGYERHLSECHTCRSSVVTLARIAAAEAAPTVLAQPVREEGRFATLKGLFTAPLLPRVAAAALAVIVLAISIPLLISRKDSMPPPAVNSSEGAGDQTNARVVNPAAPPQSPETESEGLLNTSRGRIPTSEVVPSTKAEQDKNQPAPALDETALAKQTPAETGNEETHARAARVEPPQTAKLETSRTGEGSDQGRKAESDAQLIAKDQPPAAPPPAPEQPPLGQIKAEDALRVPQRDKDKDAASITLLPGRRDGAPGAEKKRAIRPGDAVAPSQSEAAGSGAQRRLAAPSPGSMRDREDASGSASARGSNMRKVGGKKFWLSKDTWTDTDYNPNKEMPVVTVERDSDIYKELLTKRSGLKLYLMGFDEGERAIFVYKGTVYRLIPQNSR